MTDYSNVAKVVISLYMLLCESGGNDEVFLWMFGKMY